MRQRQRGSDGVENAATCTEAPAPTSGVGLLGRRHLDEAESARAPGLAIHDDRRRLDDTSLGEHLAQPRIRRRKSQTSDEELLCHDNLRLDLPLLKNVPGTRKTAPESWSAERVRRASPAPDGP